MFPLICSSQVLYRYIKACLYTREQCRSETVQANKGDERGREAMAEYRHKEKDAQCMPHICMEMFSHNTGTHLENRERKGEGLQLKYNLKSKQKHQKKLKPILGSLPTQEGNNNNKILSSEQCSLWKAQAAIWHQKLSRNQGTGW